MTAAPNSPRKLRIGVFDSGFGGLTVLRALRHVLASADHIYLGDTARLPYGSKSRETISRYARSSVGFLLEQGADLLVIACNTATAMCIDDLVAAAAPVPVIGVIEPGARAARAACIPADAAPEVLVLATAATVESHAYARELLRIGVGATEKACPLLVPLVEEGWTEHPVTEEVATIYLRDALAAAPTAGALLLGCTHYPLLRPLLRRCLENLGRPLPIVDSAEATALAVQACVAANAALRPQSGTSAEPGTSVFYATDSVAKFQRLGSEFLGEPLPEVRLIDLGG